jgi:hypothetical protein
MIGVEGGIGNEVAQVGVWVAFLPDPQRFVSGEEGAYLQDVTDRSHLPLRGKLGWMTP